MSKLSIASTRLINNTIFAMLPSPFRTWLIKTRPGWEDEETQYLPVYYSAWKAGVDYVQGVLKSL